MRSPPTGRCDLRWIEASVHEGEAVSWLIDNVEPSYVSIDDTDDSLFFLAYSDYSGSLTGQSQSLHVVRLLKLAQQLENDTSATAIAVAQAAHKIVNTWGLGDLSELDLRERALSTLLAASEAFRGVKPISPEEHHRKWLQLTGIHLRPGGMPFVA